MKENQEWGDAQTLPAPRPPGDDPSELVPVGTEIDGLRVLKYIGAGAMGVVVKAHDPALDRLVAVKIVQPRVLEHPAAVAAFMREARAMARVRHPHVVAVHSLGHWRDLPYIVMEYVPGADLESWVAAQGGPRVPVPQMQAIMTDICAAVAAMHRSGTIHGDVKPSNVLVHPTQGFLLGDLGLARFMHEGRPGEHRSVLGTPGYMAPELLSMKSLEAELAVRADVYSLAVMAYELCTGRRPFDESSIVRLLNMHATLPPPPPSACHANLGPYDDVLLDALVKDPAMRTPTVDVFYEGLVSAAAGVDASPTERRVVVVDDDEDFAELASALVQHALPDARVRVFSSAAEALAALEQEDAHIVLADLKMPDMNGLELVAAIRAMGANHTRIIIVSGMVRDEDWSVLSSLGADAFVAKPIQAEELTRILGRTSARVSIAPPPPK